jgi:hypothetical protein
MPKNPYLIENKKLVEEVREIPTYQPKYTDEEVAKLKEIFIAEQKEEIKKYQIKTSPLSPEARSKVIRKWGGGYVSEDKEGYGPCSGSCRCNCPRSDCNCESGERYVKVYMPCPADGCGNTSRSNWVHSTDSYYIWISNHANMRCEKSYCPATHKMQNWAFLCSNHSFHNGKHKSASADTWIDVVTTAGKQWGDSDLILELLIYLNTHKSEFKR